MNDYGKDFIALQIGATYFSKIAKNKTGFGELRNTIILHSD